MFPRLFPAVDNLILQISVNFNLMADIWEILCGFKLKLMGATKMLLFV